MVDHNNFSQRDRANKRERLQTTTTKTITKKYIRVEPKGSWWPWGILPLLALLLLGLYSIFRVAPSVIEKQVVQTVRNNLQSNGFNWTKVDVDGQNLILEGVGPSKSALNKAYSLAQNTSCGTWVGKLVCPIWVKNRMTLREAAPKVIQKKVAQEKVVQEKVVPKVAMKPVFHDFQVKKSEDSKIHLSGEVPSLKAKNLVIAKAKSKFKSVSESLKISKKLAFPEHEQAFSHSFNLLSKMFVGTATWKKGIFSITGESEKGINPALIKYAKTIFDAKRIAKVDIRTKAVANKEVCNKSFREELNNSSINFNSGSARISKDSFELLGRLSKISKNCPGKIVVSGHTDNSGGRAFNKSLSLKRAGAVVQALKNLGVDVSRLESKGFGPDKPIASNDTLEGMAKNRRIEMIVSE